MNASIDIHFTDFFHVEPQALEDYGAFNISLINDLPVFVDPFLLFNSENPVYRRLHDEMIDYLRFLRERSTKGGASDGVLRALYAFPEVRQNWLGFSRVGNGGSGLGPRFARSLHNNMQSVFATFGDERITEASHLEKLCLIDSGVGRDNISDFTTNLIKGFLLAYTQDFARQYLEPRFCRTLSIAHARFNYTTGTWAQGRFFVPVHNGDYVLLTPKDILTKDETWINRSDMLNNLIEVAEALPDDVLRAQLDEYLKSRLNGNEKQPERLQVYDGAVRRFPEIVDHYIHLREETGDEATARSSTLVQQTERLFVDQVREFVDKHLAGTRFYEIQGDTLTEARERVLYLKQVIENNDGYRLFYEDGKPIRREQDVQLLYKLTWFATPSDVNREVNNGRGPVDFKVSRGSIDSSLVEFKLASNSKLKQNLQSQVEVYEAANQTRQSLKVILYFSESELRRVVGVLRELRQEDNPNIVLIDACSDNKPSASNA